MSAVARPLTPAVPASPAADTIRVMVVDDAVVVRGLLGRWLAEEPGIDVIGAYRNGKLAVEALDTIDPHVIILDIEMPEMDGLTALPLLLKKKPRAAVIMASTLTQRNAEVSLRAMGLGARDYVPKPEGNAGVTTSVEFRRDIIAKVRAIGGRVAGVGAAPARPAAARPSASAPSLLSQKPFALRRFNPAVPRILAIGSSTGGPQALMSFFEAAGSDLASIPIVLAQHMPATFTPILAQHLARSSGLEAREGADGEPLKPGVIYVAPGGRHMVLGGTASSPQISLKDGAPINFCKPAVDPMFETVAALYKSAALAIVFTGMGNDGAAGAKVVADAGGNVIAQDEETSVVWGMPGATAQIGAAAAVLPLPQIAPKVRSIVKGTRV
ncbi:MAG: chemotaxis response regulator protein-glutamate methylesterase [Pseudomonadota bacterium]